MRKQGRLRTRSIRAISDPQGQGEDQNVGLEGEASAAHQQGPHIEAPEGGQGMEQEMEQEIHSSSSESGIERAIGRLARLFTRATGGRAQENPRNRNTIERARKLGAEKFNGDGDPMVAMRWLEGTEKVFRVMACTDEERVRFVEFLLIGGADCWWQSVRGKYHNPTWTDFRQEFLDRYQPRVYRENKRREFLMLTQGNMTIEDCRNRFIELARFAPGIVDGEEDKCRKFEHGLRERIRTAVV